MTDIALKIVLGVSAVIGFYFGFKLQWKYYHHFISVRDVVEQSDFIFLKQKLAVSFGMGVLFAMVTGGLALSVLYIVQDSFQPRSAAERYIPDGKHVVVHPQAPSMAPEVAKPTVPQEAPPAVVQQQNPTATTQAANPVLQTPSPMNPSQMTKEEVERLEKEKQYSGDDPIVRKRLGLPPKTQ